MNEIVFLKSILKSMSEVMDSNNLQLLENTLNKIKSRIDQLENKKNDEEIFLKNMEEYLGEMKSEISFANLGYWEAASKEVEERMSKIENKQL